jgi:hypothetical protein
MDVSFDSIEREEGTGAPKMRGRLPAARMSGRVNILLCKECPARKESEREDLLTGEQKRR